MATFVAVLALTGLAAASAQGATPAGSWTLGARSPDVKDHFFRIEVDPGEAYRVQSTAADAINDLTFGWSGVYFSQYITFEGARSGYLGLQRAQFTTALARKVALVTIWGGLDARGNALAGEKCNEFGPCVRLFGNYDWKVGHQYRFRMERSMRNGPGWWQVSLTDLTTGVAHILGELRTPEWGGLDRGNDLFLEYFWGPYDCQVLRHARATLAPIQGMWGAATALSAQDVGTYDLDGATCPDAAILPGMTRADYDSYAWIADSGNITTLGNAYRGVHNFAKYNGHAKAGMMFAQDPGALYPYLFRALGDGPYGPLPPEGQSNQWWRAIGTGYPIINDLFLRNQPLYQYEQRDAASLKVGDYFVYDNPDTKDLEYFRIKRQGAGEFPRDKSSNDDWEYVGRHWKKDEPIRALTVRKWGENDRRGRVGSIFRFADKYYRLRTDQPYGLFPVSGFDNEWWEFLGYAMGVGTPSPYPIAVASASTTAGYAPLLVNFSGAGMDPKGQKLTYRWDFGDGSAIAKSIQPSHVYAQPGRYVARLSVRNPQGLVGVSTVAVTVAEDLPPVAKITAAVTNGIAPISITLSGADSYDQDPVGRIVAYAWDFGDGAAGSTEATLTHLYDRPGLYTVFLTVNDDRGTAATTSVTVNVIANPALSKLSVGNIIMSLMGGVIPKRGQVRVKAVNGLGHPLQGVMVRGQWDGVVNGLSEGVTEADGVVKLYSPWSSSMGNFHFIVTELAKDGMTYEPGGNVRSDGEVQWISP